MISVERSAIENLKPTTDIFGNTIGVGDRVRSFDFPFLYEGKVDGMAIERQGERFAYIEGTVEAIGEDDIEGCPRYRIAVEKAVRGEGDEITHLPLLRSHVYPPVNGTPAMMSEVTIGVAKITD